MTTKKQDEYDDRIEKLEAIRHLGINPYPDSFEKTHSAAAIVTSKTGTQVQTAGRILTIREMGKICFCHIQDSSGQIQVVLRVDEIGQEEFKKFLKIFDPGDFVGIAGEIFKTKRGELSVLVKQFTMLGKTLRPLPEKWHGLKDQELLYRQRYLDLITNRETFERFMFRSGFIKALREFYWQEGFMEVETPVLANTASGALATPFITHHNALDIDVYLRIAIETHQKELIVGGMEKIFEIGRCFRNEGMDPSHLQEFTSCEHYAAYWNFEDNMRFTEKMFEFLLKKLFGSLKITIKDRAGKAVEINFKTPWPRVSFAQLLKKDSGIDITQHETDESLRAAISKKKITIEGIEKLGRGNLIDALYKATSRAKLTGPIFLVSHPVELSPLARRNNDDQSIVDRFQLVVNGWEIANAYSELVDPLEQRKRFEIQAKAKAAGDTDAHGKDDEFVRSLEHGAPPISGWGMGIDRIVTLLTNQDNLRDVVLFPLLRPEK
ncbi:MAG: lysine--tRNA ligase [Candidatus Buchananbacteria bacterium RIFCSPHIGHO2_01_FULL_47_11b]|uniref:Lysine--tRNA ligase n=1 Tax=Candidatus Buchananbacteria bacterium RIFCSPHIGHO2_01_FULL_47_11b TaxID=1797537 RepID=A0A1G1Y737_9BACT|nr:MAG: lysine--tRNA ligase [Candidatus Buchananbacteria bacterium RIFCSPHIGHO2_01_FULL_47_11b]